MNDDGDSDVLNRPVLVKSRLGTQETTGKDDKDLLLPLPGAPYKADGFALKHEVRSLVLILGKHAMTPGKTARYDFPYLRIDMGEFGFEEDGGHWFRFLVASLEPKRVTVRGYELLLIYDYIRLGRMPWIREADRPFRIEGEKIITSITVEEWEPKPRKK